MHKKFEINWAKIKGGCQSGRKVLTHNSKSDLPLIKDIIRKWSGIRKPPKISHPQMVRIKVKICFSYLDGFPDS